MQLHRIAFCLFCWMWIASPLWAEPIKIVTTVPDLAWVAKEIGGELVEVESLLSGREDVHYIDAVPSFIRKVANADIVCFNGMSLEIGWLPKVLSRSGNAQVQSGGKGYCNAGEKIDAIEVHHGHVDRSMGDLHPEGNPHYTLSPLHLIQAAKTIRLAYFRVLPKKGSYFYGRYKDLRGKLKRLHREIKTKLSPIVKKADEEALVIEYHKSFSYFFHVYGIRSMGSIEEVPGVPPSAGRLGEVALEAKANGIKLAIAANYHPERVMRHFTALSGIPGIHLPISVQVNGEIDSYEKLQHYLADSLLSSIQ